MAGLGLRLFSASNSRKLMEGARMAGNGWTWLDMAGMSVMARFFVIDGKCWKWLEWLKLLELFGNVLNCLIWMEMAVNGLNGSILQEEAVND